MEISFTDALISTDMIGAMIGTTATSGSTAGMYMWTEEVTASSTTVLPAVSKSPALTSPDFGREGTYFTCFVKAVGSSEWVALGMDSNKIVHSSDDYTFTNGTKYCVKYFVAGNGQNFDLNADFVPSVLHAISYIDVYVAGVAGCTAGTGTSTGQSVGQLVI